MGLFGPSEVTFSIDLAIQLTAGTQHIPVGTHACVYKYEHIYNFIN